MGVKVPAPDMVKWFYRKRSIVPWHRIDIYRECTEKNIDEFKDRQQSSAPHSPKLAYLRH